MKRVVQEDPTGCGIACIAMLASTKYQTIKEIAFDVLNLGNDDVFYTTASDLRKLGAVFK